MTRKMTRKMTRNLEDDEENDEEDDEEDDDFFSPKFIKLVFPKVSEFQKLSIGNFP